MRSLKLRIYFKPECHLCDDAKEIVSRVGALYPLEVETVDIEKDPEAYELYRDEIPVGFLEGRKLFKYRIDETTLRRALDAEMASRRAREDAEGGRE